MSLAPSLASSLKIAQGYPVSACTQASATSITSPQYGASPTQKLFAFVGGFTCTFDGSSLTNSFTGGDVVWTLITSGTTSSESWGIYQGRVVGVPVGTTSCSGGTLATSVYLCILGYENCAGYGWFGNGSGSGAATFAVTPQAAGSMLLAMVNDGHGSSLRTSTSTQIVDTAKNPGDNDSYWIEAPNEWFKAPGTYTYGAATPAPSSTYAFVAIEIQASSTADPAEFPYFILPQGAAVVRQDFEQHTMGRSPIPWNPERSASAWGITPAIATKPPLNGPYKATVLPDFFLRPAWNPDRTSISRAGWTQALWAIPPTWKMEPSLPANFARPAWNPERTETDRAGWTQALWAIAPQKLPEPELPEAYLRPKWNPERSTTERPASIQATWAVAPTKIPEPELADSWMRPAWNPERTHSVGIPYLPPTWPTTVVAPERNARPPWDPEKGWQSRAGWIQALWAIAPQKLPEPELPERFLAPWRPPDQQPVWPPFQFAAVLVPTWGYEMYGPQTFLRPLWNPDRTGFSRAGFTQQLWAVPPTKIPEPVLPAWFTRPMWNPERSHSSSTPLIIPRGPVPTTLPERYPPVWNPERTGVIIAQRIIIAPAPLLSWRPELLERFVQALRSPPNLDLFSPALPPILSTVAIGPPMFGFQDAAALMGKADLIVLVGRQEMTALQGKQAADGLTGEDDSDPVKGRPG